MAKDKFSEQKKSVFDFPTALSDQKTMREAFGHEDKPKPKLSMQERDCERERRKLWASFGL